MSNRLHIGAARGNNVNADHLHYGQDSANSDTDAHDIPLPEDVYHRPSQSYPGCFGLPYQDHNYAALPPMSPPPPPPRSPTPPPPAVNGPAEVEEEVKVPVVSNEEEVVEDSVTRCICGYLHDDGYMICCDKCSVWQHIDCMEIDRNNIPESYCCELCEPRELDVERAKMIQRRRREEIASLGRKPVQPKPKGSKQRRVSKSGARLLKTGRLAKSQQLKREKKLKLTKKEKENVKDALKKQKIGKTGATKEKKMKKKLNTSLTQNKADFWNFLNEPYCPVQEVKENEYSSEILEFLSRVKTNGVHSPHSIGVFPEELLVQLYQVSDVKKNRKGLEATDLIVPGKAVIEFKGRVMLRQHYLPDPLLDESQPSVLFYSKFEGLDLCIDASAFSGDARFIRRSCSPNAEMCHIIDNGNLQFIVQAKKEIPKGTEITIPFDFNYQESSACVECACAKINCPVAKFWKKIKMAQKSPEKPKRKRQASGEDRVRRNSQGKSSPVKVCSSGTKSPVKYSPTKLSPGVPAMLAFTESSEAVDVTAPVDTFDFSSLAKSTGPRRSCRAPEVKEEREVKPRLVQGKECSKAPAVQDNLLVVDSDHTANTDSSHHPASESEHDSASECQRKLTREERKMEAIMKAFEKLERREERRKEALARLDKKHVDHEEPGDHFQGLEGLIGNGADCKDDYSVEQPCQSTADPYLSPETDTKLVIKTEDSSALIDSPPKSVRNRRMKRKRRNSRVMSAVEPLYTSPPRPQAPVAPELPQPLGEEVKEEPMELPPDPPPYIPTTPATPALDPLPSTSGDDTTSYLFHKKKKYLFTELGGWRSPEGPVSGVRDEEMFVSCTPGPRSSMEHIQRRNSSTATCGRMSDSAKGNAKKRWLRQAMYETVPLTVETDTTSTTPSSTGSSSPSHHVPGPLPGPSATVTMATMGPTAVLHSPTGSPSDFVTPLKKRRLAPEFLPSMSSAVRAIPVVSESAAVDSEATATSTFTTPTGDRTVPPEPAPRPPLTDKRLRMKGTCLFGRRSGNGLALSSSIAGSVSNGPVNGSQVSPAQTSGACVSSVSTLEQLAASCTPHTVGLASAGSLASSTVGNSADREVVSEARPAASSCSPVTQRQEASSVDVPLVDSSDTALDTGLQPTGHSDHVDVCSSNSDLSAACVNSVDSDCRGDTCFRHDEVVAESSSTASSGRLCPLQDQDEDVSESQPVTDRLSVEDEGNEASGSVSVSEELSRHSDSRTYSVAADCQVNSSQDLMVCGLSAAGACSPSEGEAECRLSPHSVHQVHRTGQPQCAGQEASDRTGVSSAQDSLQGHTETSGVSSGTVSSQLSMLDAESLGSSDMDCGPSSSTQTSQSRPMDTVDVMLCNSSDITGSSAISFSYEDSNVDSTTQNGRARHIDGHQCDTAGSHRQATESEESCCDSNSDEQAEVRLVAEGGSVSSSGPADSQGDVGVHSNQRTVSTSSCVVSCSTASVSSSHYSASHSDRTLAMSVSSSVYSNGYLDCVQSRQGSAVSASTSFLPSTDSSDLAGPSQSTSQRRLPDPSGPSQSSSHQGQAEVSRPSQSSARGQEEVSGPSQSSCHPSHSEVSGPSQSSCHPSHSEVSGPSQSTSHGQEDLGPSQSSSHHVHTLCGFENSTDGVSAAPVSDSGSREVTGADTSDKGMSGPFLAAEQCEASTSYSSERRLSEDSDCSSRPVSSSMAPTPSELDLSVSSGGADTPGDRALVNGGTGHGSVMSTFSEDSSGSTSVTMSLAVSSSEAQAAPTKRKVSLSEYRNRRKDRTGSTASTSSITSPNSSSDHRAVTGRSSVDRCISLAPLPLFEAISIRENRENREHKEEREKREKPMSLSDRLRIEFGLETTSEDEEKASSSGSRKSSDIPPPPPLPRTGKLGGVGVRRASSVGGPRALSTENEEDGQHAASSTFPSTLPSATTTTTTPTGYSPGLGPSQAALSSWLAKLHTHLPGSALVDTTGPSPRHPHPSTSPVFATSLGHQQRLSQSYHVAGAGASQLPNGSHPPAAFSTTLFPASASQGQLHPQSYASGKLQQPPAPPPPPNTAYSQYLAQSRTHCVGPHTPPLGPRHTAPLGVSVSVPQAPHTATMGNGVTQSRHAPLNSSSNHSHGRFHFSSFSHADTVSHKGSSYATDRKRH